MARATFGGSVADYVVSAGSDGLLRLASASLTMWTAATGGTKVTDLLLNGATVTAIPVGKDGAVPVFQGPDGATELWADAGHGRVRLTAPVTVVDSALATLVPTSSGSQFSTALIASYVTSGPSTADVTAGNRKHQPITGNKWFKSLMVFGNNAGLAADPRQPFQVNNVIDGSKLDGSTYLGDKAGVVLDTTFVGGFSGEVGYGAVDPGHLFGAGIFTKSGSTAGDLAGITDFEAGFSEAHLYTPGATLGTFIGLQTVANIESTSVGATVANAYGLYARGPVDHVGGVVANAYSIYAEAPTAGPDAAHRWALYAAGLAEFAGQTKFTGLTPNTSGAGAPAGVYVGRNSGSGSVVEFSNATNNVSVGISLANQLEINLAGVRNIAAFTVAGGFNMDGAGTFGRGTVVNTPGSQSATKGAYIGRNSGGTVGVELADGSSSFRVANDSAGNLVFEKSGVAVLGKFNGSGDLTITKGLSFAPSTQVTAPAAGAAAALPATPAGYADVTIGGTLRKIAYY